MTLPQSDGSASHALYEFLTADNGDKWKSGSRILDSERHFARFAVAARVLYNIVRQWLGFHFDAINRILLHCIAEVGMERLLEPLLVSRSPWIVTKFLGKLEADLVTGNCNLLDTELSLTPVLSARRTQTESHADLNWLTL
jgi:hypothetical protein